MRIDDTASAVVAGPDGRDVKFGDLPPIIKAILVIECAAYDVIAQLPFRDRTAVASHLRAIADQLESIDPLRYRREEEPRWAALPGGHA
jgi:hypothetical protein